MAQELAVLPVLTAHWVPCADSRLLMRFTRASSSSSTPGSASALLSSFEAVESPRDFDALRWALLRIMNLADSWKQEVSTTMSCRA